MESCEKVGYKQIFKQKEYCKIIFANMINRFGDSIDSIAFTWLVYEITKSATWSATIFALNMLPTIILQPFTGAAVERRNKKNIMVISDLIRGFIVIALAVAYMKGVINPWIMVAFTLTISSVEAFCLPASTAIIPLVLEEKYYEFGISLNSALMTVLQLIGTAIAGIIIGIFGVETAIIIDAITFFCSALIKICLKVKEDINKVLQSSGYKQYFSDLKEGFKYLRKKQVLVNFCILTFLVNAMMVPMNSFLAPLVSNVLEQGSELLSAIGTATVIGMFIGSTVFPYVSKKSSIGNTVFRYGLGLSVSGGILPLGSIVKENTILVYAITIIAAVGIGFFASVLNTIINVQFLKCVQQDYLARTQSLLGAGSAAAMPVTSVLLGIMVNYISVKNIMIISGILSATLFTGFKFINIKFEEENEQRDNILQSN